MEVQEEENVQDQQSVENTTGEEQFGFRPLPEKAAEAEKPRVTPEMHILKEKINLLISRYPELTLRSSAATMASLDTYDEPELKNILNNCINDLQRIRGVPAAEFILHLICGMIDWKLLPGYLDRCMNDVELKRDVESETMSWIGVMNTRLNIAFRMLNNAYLQLYQPDYPYYDGEEEPELEQSRYMRNVPVQDDQQEERANKRARTSGGENSTSH